MFSFLPILRGALSQHLHLRDIEDLDETQTSIVAVLVAVNQCLRIQRNAVIRDVSNVCQKDFAWSMLFKFPIKQIVRHHVCKEGEPNKKVVVSKMEITTQYGAVAGKTQTRETQFYNINSRRAVHLRIRATGILKEYITKGFALDGERLKQDKMVFGKEYFHEMLKPPNEPHGRLGGIQQTVYWRGLEPTTCFSLFAMYENGNKDHQIFVRLLYKVHPKKEGILWQRAGP